MNKKTWLTVVIAIVLLAGLFGTRYLKDQSAKKALAGRKPVPATVATAKATAEQWRETIHAVGTLESFQGITIRSEIEGRILDVAFDSGAVVKAGDLLVEMDSAAESAQLRAEEASGRLAQLNLERARELRRTNSNTQADLDSAQAAADQATAAVESIKVTLAKKRIVAPFAGRIGIRQVSLGQFLNKGDPVATLESTDPIYADFTVPQQEITHVVPGLPVKVTIDAFPNRDFDGKIEATDPRVSETTRNVRVRATLANPKGELRPGMFARVDVQLPQVRNVVVLPTTAIVYSPYGDSVYVVGSNDKGATVAQQRFVKIGPKRGDQVALLDGVKDGEQVVTAGQGKLRPGTPVKVDNTVIPANSAAPTPAES